MALISYTPPTDPYLDIVHYDDHFVVINKPSGLLSVPGNQPQYYDSAMSRVKEKYGFCEPAHRLDMSTSGLILFALSKAADRELKRASFVNVNRKNIIKHWCGDIWRKTKGKSTCH